MAVLAIVWFILEMQLSGCGSKFIGVEGWKGPYSMNILDPRGIPYQFEMIDETRKIYSYGPDRNNGTGDDITNR